MSKLPDKKQVRLTNYKFYIKSLQLKDSHAESSSMVELCHEKICLFGLCEQLRDKAVPFQAHAREGHKFSI